MPLFIIQTTSTKSTSTSHHTLRFASFFLSNKSHIKLQFSQRSIVTNQSKVDSYYYTLSQLIFFSCVSQPAIISTRVSVSPSKMKFNEDRGHVSFLPHYCTIYMAKFAHNVRVQKYLFNYWLNEGYMHERKYKWLNSTSFPSRDGYFAVLCWHEENQLHVDKLKNANLPICL